MKRSKVLGLLLGVIIGINTYSQRQKAPMYISAYAYLYIENNNQNTTIPMPENMWQNNIDYMSENLAPLGFDMICTDGWGEDIRNSDGFRIKHHSSWENEFSNWANYAEQKGVKLGLYENPLWINEYISATSGLYNPNENAMWFNWLQVGNVGAEDYLKRYIEYYASFGVDFLRVDFLSWYEDGIDKLESLTAEHGRDAADYQTALSWLNKYCDANDIQLSLVMPHLYNDGANERAYAPGSMIRVNEDACDGGWYRFSEIERGEVHPIWSKYHNAFDGLVYWSRFSGFDDSQKQMILDGDFIWLSSFDNDEEKKSVLSLNLMAGGAIALTEYDINDFQKSIHLLQNREIFELNNDGFVGKPLSNDPTNIQSQVWHGRMSDGDYVLALFNRENTAQARSFSFSSLEGNPASLYTRDLWERENIGLKSSINISLAAHACKVYRLSTEESELGNLGSIEPVQMIQNSQMYIGGSFNSWTPGTLQMEDVDGVWTVSGLSLEAGNYEMKFVNTSDWSGDDWGNSTGLSGSVTLSTGGLPNLSFSLSESGLYDIYFNDMQMEYNIIPQKATSLWKNQIKQIKLSPNPATEILNISGVEGIIKVSIYSLQGKKVLEKSGFAEAGSFCLNISDVLTGAYVAIVNDEQQNFYCDKVVIVE
ncbi:T9SS type A sorting domain-containing protein [Carboxylicivirga caseinilyticus]|uniref:T9SS type A sorting domain-containing protein n=1 Tax=Carboxylicivirga caseinilyticus TaxID=3417572 RepID=UPI003D33F6BA|nr:T9SS type A sorting domain-containing protein [Marinilabiliaceae bacterium A049]